MQHLHALTTYFSIDQENHQNNFSMNDDDDVNILLNLDGQFIFHFFGNWYILLRLDVNIDTWHSRGLRTDEQPNVVEAAAATAIPPNCLYAPALNFYAMWR